jgi:hypothetical protein
MDVSTRDAAIKNFTYMTDYELDEDDHDQHGGDGSPGMGSGGANGLNQKTKSILISPALIYKEKIENEASGASVAAPSGNKNRQRPLSIVELPKAPTSPNSSSSATTLPEEELIKRQKWSCYGSTEVELLVLQNASTGAEHIAAVAPRNVGVSIRKIDADEGSITSIGIGWLNIVVDAGPAFLEEDDDEQEDVERSTTSRNRQDAGDRRSSDPTKRAEAEQPTSQSPEEVPPRPSQDSIARTRTQLKRYYEFAGKVGEQMKVNVHFLRETLQDDFMSRSVTAGNKIVNNLPRTLERTAAFFQKIVDRWTGGDGSDGAGGGGGDGGPDL